MNSFTFKEIEINKIKIRNRLVMPAMVTNFANSDGSASEQTKAYYLRRAKGGFGLIIVEALAVHLLGRGFRLGLGLWDDLFVKNLESIVKVVHAEKAKIFAQLLHAGAQTTEEILGSTPVAPTALFHPGYKNIPRELNIDEIIEIVSSFGKAAMRAKQAGFDGVEVHGSHGYLISQFMSSFTNRRTDLYGGSLRDRLRLPIEILKETKKYCGNEFPVIIRIAGDERISEGRKIEETKVAVGILDKAGYDAFHVTSATTASSGFVAPPYYVETAFNLAYADQIKKITEKPVISTGKINDADLIEMILSENKADMIGVGRGSIADPDFPNKIKMGLSEKILPCIGCLQGCIGNLYHGKPITCLANPIVGKEKLLPIPSVENPKKILIVGGGPAGLICGKYLSSKGNQVTLYEKNSKLGGQFLLACMPPHKQTIAQLIKQMIREAKNSGVKIELNIEVTVDLIKKISPDVVIVASGGFPIMPKINISEDIHVVNAWEVLSGEEKVGEKVAVIGAGSVGCEVADFIAVQGKNVTLFEMKDEMAIDMVHRVKQFLIKRLQEEKVAFELNSKVLEICNKSIVADCQGRKKSFEGFDTVVFALGTRSNEKLLADINSADICTVYGVGDCFKIGDALYATQSALELALAI